MQSSHTEQLRPTAEQGYEHSGVSIRGMTWFAFLLVAGLVAVNVLLYYIWKGLAVVDRSRDVAPSALMNQLPMAANAQGEVFPEPQLQPSPGHDRLPAVDLNEMRAGELEQFKNRGWYDEARGQVVVPGEIADRVIQSGGAAGGAR